MADNPLAALGTAAPPTPAANPLAGLGTPVPPEPGMLEHAEDVGVGIAKGAGDTVSTISHLLNKIPVVGETLAPSSGVQALDKIDESKNAYQTVGKGIETAGELALTAGATSELTMVKELETAEKLTGAARAAKYVDLARKYPILAQTLNMASDHPWLAKMILEGGKGAVAGGVSGAAKTGSVSGAVKGAAAGATAGAAFAGAGLMVNPFRKALAQAPDYLSDVWAGLRTTPEEIEGASSQQAASTLRDVTQKATQVPTAQPRNLRNILDEPIAAFQKEASRNYKLVDAATDGKWQINEDALADNTAALRANRGLPAEADLKATRTRLQWQRDALIQQAKTKGVADAPMIVQTADQQFKQMQALKELDKAVFKNYSVIDADGGVNVKKAFENLTKLQEKTKFGGPRLEQALGSSNASEYLRQTLDTIRKSGDESIDRYELAQRFLQHAKVASAAAGIGGAATASTMYLYHALMGD